jgi:hypothetical protein
VILLVIAAVWALYLVPLWLRSRGAGGRGGGYGGSRSMMARGPAPTAMFTRDAGPGRRAPGGGVAAGLGSAVGALRTGPPRTAAEARRRRRDVLIGLGGLAVLTLLLALTVGGVLWVLHLLVDIALVGFGWLVHEHETRSRERAEKVRTLPVQRRAPQAAMAPERRRVAN